MIKFLNQKYKICHSWLFELKKIFFFDSKECIQNFKSKQSEENYKNFENKKAKANLNLEIYYNEESSLLLSEIESNYQEKKMFLLKYKIFTLSPVFFSLFLVMSFLIPFIAIYIQNNERTFSFDFYRKNLSKDKFFKVKIKKNPIQIFLISFVCFRFLA